MRRLLEGIAIALMFVFGSCAARAESGWNPPEPKVEAQFVEVRIDDEIIDRTAEAVEAAVKKVRDDGAPGLRVKINSPGGGILSGLRIVTALESLEVPVSCEVEGVAASMAAVILESPGCRHRVVRPWSVVMFHEGHTGFGGGFGENDGEAVRNALSAMNRAIGMIVAPRLGLTLEQYLGATTGGRELWFAGVDAPPNHVADEVKGVARSAAASSGSTVVP